MEGQTVQLLIHSLFMKNLGDFDADPLKIIYLLFNTILVAIFIKRRMKMKPCWYFFLRVL